MSKSIGTTRDKLYAFYHHSRPDKTTTIILLTLVSICTLLFITIILVVIIIVNMIAVTLVQIPDGLTAGDVRATIQPTLASIQTLFFKYLDSAHAEIFFLIFLLICPKKINPADPYFHTNTLPQVFRLSTNSDILFQFLQKRNPPQSIPFSIQTLFLNYFAIHIFVKLKLAFLKFIHSGSTIELWKESGESFGWSWSNWRKFTFCSLDKLQRNSRSRQVFETLIVEFYQCWPSFYSSMSFFYQETFQI